MANARFEPSTTSVAEAQREMRAAYFAGAPGMLVSAMVWLAASGVSWKMGPDRAIWTLFIGGMLIHPVAVVLCKLMGRPAKHSTGNPMGSLAMATTLWMIMSLPLAYAASVIRIEWFFPAMMLVIGGRYLAFSTVYGLRVYWLCGAALAIAAWMASRYAIAPELGAATGAAIEALFAAVLFRINPASAQDAAGAVSAAA